MNNADSLGCTVDRYNYHIAPNPDRSYTRLLNLPRAPVTELDDTTSQVLTKDVSIDHQTKNTWFRVYLTSVVPPPGMKLPLVVYFHGGGFLMFSAATEGYHNCCCDMALLVSAVVVSVEYRLAPEHRLPAAYHDAVDSVYKIRDCGDEWFTKYADLSETFLAGISAGANMAYHAGLRISTAAGDLDPLKIRGLIFHRPFFGWVRRTSSELRQINDQILPLSAADLMWELALPFGEDRDHEYCNPKDGSMYQVEFENVKKMGWKVLLVAWDKDPLYDNQTKLAAMLRRIGLELSCILRSGDGDSHRVRDF